MHWGVFRLVDGIHVMPVREGCDTIADAFGHAPTRECFCSPTVECRDGALDLLIHSTWPKRLNLRVWNLRRELRGRRFRKR